MRQTLDILVKGVKRLFYLDYDDPDYDVYDPYKHYEAMFDELEQRSIGPPSEKDETFFYVFVYGSLLSGLSNHSLLSKTNGLGSSVRVLDDAVTSKRFRMVSLGAFPGVLKAWERPYLPSEQVRTKSLYRPIMGEVYKVDTSVLKSLDGLEGNGRFYTRELQEIEGLTEEEHGTTRAWIYILPSLEKNYSKGGHEFTRYNFLELAEVNDDGCYDWKMTKNLKKFGVRK